MDAPRELPFLLSLVDQAADEQQAQSQIAGLASQVVRLVAQRRIDDAQVVPRLGRDQIVARVGRYPLAPDRIGARSPDIAGVEVNEAAVEQRRGQVISLRRIPLEQDYRRAARRARTVMEPRFYG